jgi:hypothetical protein
LGIELAAFFRKPARVKCDASQDLQKGVDFSFRGVELIDNYNFLILEYAIA